MGPSYGETRGACQQPDNGGSPGEEPVRGPPLKLWEQGSRSQEYDLLCGIYRADVPEDGFLPE